MLSYIFDRVRTSLQKHLPGVREVEVRLYGGWLDQDGLFLPLAEWILADLASHRSLSHGIRLKPTLCVSLAQRPGYRLFGTCRTDTRPRRQKMIDLMVGFDAHFFARTYASPIVVLCDDEDFVPAAILSRVSPVPKSDLVWVKSNSMRRRPNDLELTRLGVRISYWE